MSDATENKEAVPAEQGSPVADLLATRRTPGDGPLSTGVWYSDFSRVIKEADERMIPFFALWLNSDQCALSRRFASIMRTPEFLERQRMFDALWWLGCGSDSGTEDGRDGTGFTWCQGPSRSVGVFPFFTVRCNSRKHDPYTFFGSGPDYDRGLEAAEGAAAVSKRIGSIFRVFEVQPPRSSFVHIDTSLHIRFNPSWDAAHIVRFSEAIQRNGGHCLCQAKSPDSVCMCKEFLERATPGPCKCGAYEKFSVKSAEEVSRS